MSNTTVTVNNNGLSLAVNLVAPTEGPELDFNTIANGKLGTGDFGGLGILSLYERFSNSGHLQLIASTAEFGKVELEVQSPAYTTDWRVYWADNDSIAPRPLVEFDEDGNALNTSFTDDGTRFLEVPITIAYTNETAFWDQAISIADVIQEGEIQYGLFGQNSNTFINSVM